VKVTKKVATYDAGRRIRHTEEITETMKERNGEEKNRYSERRKIISLHKGNHTASEQKEVKG
jgi:hypothetical protein